MFDLARLTQLVETHGTVARVVVASTKGSTPREVGAEMFVFEGGQTGTIGGGNLEFIAIADAIDSLSANQTTSVKRSALGPQLNQCCGGAVTVVTEVFTGESLPVPGSQGYLRRIEGCDEAPDRLTRALQRANGLGELLANQFLNGWLLEPMSKATTQLIIYGAGHVGTALAVLMDPLPEFEVILADDREASLRPETAITIHPVQPTLQNAEPSAIHIIMTHAHDLDLALCHGALSRPTAGINLIGSATKWARFRKRLIALGHVENAVDRINCPIGNPSMGKHPQAIAIGVASELMQMVKPSMSQRKAV